MANEVIELEEYKRVDTNMPVTQADVDEFQRKRALLKKFIESQLVEGIDNDYAVIPGTQKKSLLKPGAEKLEKLFGMGHTFTLVDKEVDRKGNFAMFTYKCRVYLLANPGVVIAESDGICNSHEKKYKTRAIYKNRQKIGEEETPVSDVLNTLSKMSQKRALVGAIIAATAGGDYLSQDIETKEDLAAHGMDPERQPTARVQATIPKPTASASNDQVKDTPSCDLCGSTMRRTKKNDAWNCPNWADDTKGKHTYIKD